MKCSICKGKIDEHKTPEGEVYWTHGHNAEPVNEGRCCTKCNNNAVLPERMAEFLEVILDLNSLLVNE